ncbi:UvrD-helicase domain-containing protein [Mesorhizobium sp. M0062]|uniref:UvrD-helicase domain-containing protein n=1 Tax=Mesorhizobium sp. M0062 TaxID=2956867 RepID=UPI0033357440
MEEALAERDKRVAILTYTNNNLSELVRKLYELNGSIPGHIEVQSWFRFLLREMTRPYRAALHPHRIDGLAWSPGRSDIYASATNVGRFYFSSQRAIYSDKIARFACLCDEKTQGAVLRRLRDRFDHIFVDEVQDLAGWDLDVLELILKAGIRLTVVGDHRQATFQTNFANRHGGFAGPNIVKKFVEWESQKLAEITYSLDSHRCQQPIVDLADRFFPNEPKTVSRNDRRTGHDGVFALSRALAPAYLARYQPQVLRLNRSTDCGDASALNFGEAKGLTFDRVLIFPHKAGAEWLQSGDFATVQGSASKLYVGITRARHSVTFVTDGPCRVEGITTLLGLDE